MRCVFLQYCDRGETSRRPVHHRAPHAMPILLLLVVALVSGLLIALVFDRLAPAKGATAAAADAVEARGRGQLSAHVVARAHRSGARDRSRAHAPPSR